VEHYLVIAVIAVAVIVALTSVGSRLGVAPPLVIIVVGVAISLLPAMDEPLSHFTVSGDVVLIGILPPLLYASAVSVPVVEFRRDLLAVGALAVALVVGTAVGLGLLLYQFLGRDPLNVPLFVCIALGAIMAPTDAVATSIVKRLGVPSRIVTLLDGESLLNDATSLVLLQAALAGLVVTKSGDFASGSVLTIAREFVVSAVLATAIGAVVGWLAVKLRARIANPAATTAASFIVPFVAFVPAETLHASGLVAVVVAGLVCNQLAAHHLPAAHRMNEEANWRTIEYLLEGAVFLLMGLQLRSFLESTPRSQVWLAVGLGGLCIVAAVACRGVFVTGLGVFLNRVTKRKIQRKERWETMGDAFGLDMADPDSWSVEDLWAVREAAQTPTAPGLDGIEAQRRRVLETLLQNRVTRPVVKAGRRLRDAAGGGNAARRARRFELLKSRLARYFADVNYLLREPMGPREGVLLVWAGMRGVVTLAAAQTLDWSIGHRSLLILIAFTVAAGSMLLQGGTLGWVAKALKLAGTEATPEGERADLDHVLGEAALAALHDPELCQKDGRPYDPRLIALLTLRLHITRLNDVALEDTAEEAAAEGIEEAAEGTAAAILERARRRLVGDSEDEDDDDEDILDTPDRKRQHRELRLVMLHAMREALLEARALGTYCHQTLSDALAVLDADEIGLELRARTVE
jgi:CPA1 family monovalent cation:H+ antiporter